MATIKFEEVTVTAASAKKLTVPGSARKATIQPSVDVRLRLDGTNPTSSVGVRIPTDSFVVLDEGDAIAAAFRGETADGVLRVHYHA